MKKKTDNITSIENIDYVPDSLSNIINILKDNGLYDDTSDDINDIIRIFSYLFKFTRDVSSRGLWILRVLHELEKSINSLDRKVKNDEEYSGLESIVKSMKRNIDATHYLSSSSSDSKTQYNVADIVEQSIFNMSYRLEYHNIRILTNIKSDEPEIIFSIGTANFKTLRKNRVILLSTIMSIIDNAVYWTRKNEDKWISVTLQKINKRNAIVIADNGPGFSDDTEYLSKPFVSSIPEKIGLGLYFCKYMLESIGYKLAFPNKDNVTLFKSPDGEKIDKAVVAIIL